MMESREESDTIVDIYFINITEMSFSFSILICIKKVDIHHTAALAGIDHMDIHTMKAQRLS